MIYDILPHAHGYEKLHPLFPAAFNYLRQFDPTPGNVAPGRYELQGSDLYALVQTYETQTSDKLRFESHHRYIDLQYIAAGNEIIYHAQAATLAAGEPYNPDRDLQFYTPSHLQNKQQLAQPIMLSAGTWTLLFPHDAHMPMACAGTPSTVLKVVVKIRV
ncbi:MAG: DUF386 domain-containing protein [Phycisphaerales bacterium]|nr:DUF386 domain-containing protein [Phycisphaerales bacterium]